MTEKGRLETSHASRPRFLSNVIECSLGILAWPCTQSMCGELHCTALCVHALDVSIIVLGCCVKVAHLCVDVCNGAVGVCIPHKVIHLLADLQHPQQVLNGCLVLTLQCTVRYDERAACFLPQAITDVLCAHCTGMKRDASVVRASLEKTKRAECRVTHALGTSAP